MFTNFKPKRIEPFFFRGVESIITSKEHAIKVVRQNMYYLNAFTLAFIALYIARIYFSDEKLVSYLYIAIAIFFGSMSFLTYKLMSRISSVILFIVAFATMLFLGWFGIFGMRFLFAMIVAMAAFRCIQATLYFQKATVENV